MVKIVQADNGEIVSIAVEHATLYIGNGADGKTPRATINAHVDFDTPELAFKKIQEAVAEIAHVYEETKEKG